jgi:ABC-type amino acid transport substrate-binding protein
MYKLLTILFGLIAVLSNAQEIENSSVELKLVVPEFPPYTYLEQHKAVGIGIDLVEPVLKNVQLNASIKVVKDYALALFLVKNGQADGFFLASQNPQRDEVAVFSEPLLNNRWCWYISPENQYMPDHPAFKHHAKIAAIRNTNTQHWLLQQGYKVIGKPTTPQSLYKMMLAKRVNAIFIAEVVFENTLPPELTQWKKIVAVEKPFGIYLSKSFVQQHPAVLLNINAEIKKMAK